MLSKTLRRIVPAGISLLLGGLAIVILPTAGRAQFSLNRITGQVTDQSGAVIVGASVTARELDTGAITEAKTNERGYYLMQLPIGTYDVRASGTGFQTTEREKVPVDVGADVHLDFKLGLAAAQQTIDVVAQGAPLLRPDSQHRADCRRTDIGQRPPLGSHRKGTKRGGLPGAYSRL